MIMVDRKQLKNPNGLILGTPGSGKSFSAKREMTNAFLITEDDIIVCDPEAEYFPLVQKLGGQVIRISPVSTDYINPLDINTNYSEEENPLTLKSDFILSMCELIVGGKDGLQPYGALYCFEWRSEGDWGRAESPQCARRRIPLPCLRRGLTRRLRRGSGTCSPKGRSYFSFDGERKVCKRKPAARRYGKKAPIAHFDGGARNVARNGAG